MDTQETQVLPAADSRSGEVPKRRQIIDGACQVFLKRGFDAASMGEIAREAGVSKGTLYVYFKSKEELFEAIVEEQCGLQGELIFTFDATTTTSRPCSPGSAMRSCACVPHARHLTLRTVIAIAERMPELGAKFYSSGPASDQL
jgi:AcrR family transcriptional regulator